MKGVRVLGMVCVLTSLVHLETADDAAVTQSSSSEEIARHVKEGNVDAVKYMYRKQKLRNEKYAYICACSSIREMNRYEFRAFGGRPEVKSLPALQKWMWYLDKGINPTLYFLRPWMHQNASEYYQFSVAMCKTYSICGDHILAVNDTVSVAFSAQENCTETVLDVLDRERCDNLITEQDMTYVNFLYKAHQMRPIPYAVYKRADCADINYAVPSMMNTNGCARLPREHKKNWKSEY